MVQSTTLFWNVSDHVWHGTETLSLDNCVSASGPGQELGILGEDECEQTISSMIWLRLLLLLVEVSVDERLEIRHSR